MIMKKIQLDNNQKIAFARIISDLIEADFIVDEGEMKYLKDEIMDGGPKITKPILENARRKTFEEAIRILKTVRDSTRKEIVECLCKASLSDGTCVPSEALLLMAVISSLREDGEVYSVPSYRSHIENMKVLYIESESGTPTDDYIFNHYRAISNEFLLAGFDFVYIRKIAEDYKKLSPDYLRDVISFMSPSATEDEVNSIMESLCNISTSRFTKDLLYGKMGIPVLAVKPSLLIKIGQSYLVEASHKGKEERVIYDNYLCIPALPNVLKQVTDQLDVYKGLVSKVNFVEVQPTAKKFKYFGFHKSLFDLVAFVKRIKQEYRLVIDISSKNRTIAFYPLESSDKDGALELDKRILGNKGLALYTMILVDSLKCGGTNWSSSELRNGSFLRKINNVYFDFSGGNSFDRNEKCESQDDIERIKTMRNQLVSKLKKQIRAKADAIDNFAMFMPELKIVEKSSVYYVPITSEYVFVKQGKEEIKIRESRLWL